MLNCHVVQDLLPSYLEGLTSEGTNREIEEHLCTCVTCRKVRADMEAELPVETAKEPGVKVLKTLQLNRIFQVIMVIVAVFGIIFFATDHYTRYDFFDTSEMEQQLEAYRDDVKILQTATLWNRAYVLYTCDNSQGLDDEFGVLELVRLVDGSYGHASSTENEMLTYCAWPVQTGRFHYLLICGTRELPEEVATFKVTGEYKGTETVCHESEVEDGSFLRFVPVDRGYQNVAVRYYAADGSEINVWDLVRQMSEEELSGRTDRDVSAFFGGGLSFGVNAYNGSGNRRTGLITESIAYDELIFILLTLALMCIRYILYQGVYNRFWAWLPVGTLVALSAMVSNANLIIALIILGIKLILRRLFAAK